MPFQARLVPASVLAFGSIVTLALLHGCQEVPEPTEPQLAAAAAQYALTVAGGGSGSGVGRSSPAGINCTITAGAAASTGCTAQSDKGTAVTLTATPEAGHSFKGWFGSCSG